MGQWLSHPQDVPGHSVASPALMVALAPPMWSMLPPLRRRTLSTPHSGFLRLRLPGRRGEASSLLR